MTAMNIPFKFPACFRLCCCMCAKFCRKVLGITEQCPDFCITRWNSYTQVAVWYIKHYTQFTRALSALVKKQGNKGDDALRRLVIDCANKDYTMQACVLASWGRMWLTQTFLWLEMDQGLWFPLISTSIISAKLLFAAASVFAPTADSWHEVYATATALGINHKAAFDMYIFPFISKFVVYFNKRTAFYSRAPYCFAVMAHPDLTVASAGAKQILSKMPKLNSPAYIDGNWDAFRLLELHLASVHRLADHGIMDPDFDMHLNWYYRCVPISNAGCETSLKVVKPLRIARMTPLSVSIEARLVINEPYKYHEITDAQLSNKKPKVVHTSQAPADLVVPTTPPTALPSTTPGATGSGSALAAMIPPATLISGASLAVPTVNKRPTAAEYAARRERDRASAPSTVCNEAAMELAVHSADLTNASESKAAKTALTSSDTNAALTIIKQYSKDDTLKKGAKAGAKELHKFLEEMGCGENLPKTKPALQLLVVSFPERVGPDWVLGNAVPLVEKARKGGRAHHVPAVTGGICGALLPQQPRSQSLAPPQPSPGVTPMRPTPFLTSNQNPSVIAYPPQSNHHNRQAHMQQPFAQIQQLPFLPHNLHSGGSTHLSLQAGFGSSAPTRKPRSTNPPYPSLPPNLIVSSNVYPFQPSVTMTNQGNEQTWQQQAHTHSSAGQHMLNNAPLPTQKAQQISQYLSRSSCGGAFNSQPPMPTQSSAISAPYSNPIPQAVCISKQPTPLEMQWIDAYCSQQPHQPQPQQYFHPAK